MSPLAVQRARFFLRRGLTPGRWRHELLTHDGPLSLSTPLAADSSLDVSCLTALLIDSKVLGSEAR